MCLRCGIPLCARHAPTKDKRCFPCEHDYRTRTDMLQRVAEGELQATFGRFFVGFIGVTFLPGIIATSLGLLPLAAGIPIVATALAGFTYWYRRTPPRQLTARRMLAKARKKFLAKRARVALPAARAALPSAEPPGSDR